jgi:hypothetical protein
MKTIDQLMQENQNLREGISYLIEGCTTTSTITRQNSLKKWDELRQIEHNQKIAAEYILPSNHITEDMIKRSRVDDNWHFANNLNAMIKHGYCKICGLTPDGCKREGCAATNSKGISH